MAVKGVDLILHRLEIIKRNVEDAAMQELDDIANELLKASRDAAPRDTDRMIGEAETDNDDRRAAGSFARSVYYNVEYAIYQHELVYRPGEKTARHLGTSRPGAGRGFLLRPYLKLRPDIPKRLQRVGRKAIAQSVR